jgi:tRNA(Ile)-lysidine synthase
MSLVSKVEQRIIEQQLLSPGDAVVVAVSGGPDSVALLHVLFALSAQPEWEWRLIVAHVNHQFRGEESDREAQRVAEMARQLGLPCEVASIDVPDYIAQTGLNPQAAAREKRYEFLHQVASRCGAQKIALGHHADDQAETVLMRFLRGTGLSGLAGIPEKRIEKKVELIRPFLRIYKSEIMQYVYSHNLLFSKDSSNDSRKYARNRIRLDVMPFLKQYNPQLPESLNRLAELARAEDEYMEREAERIFQRMVTVHEWPNAEKPGSREAACEFRRTEFAGLPVALQRRLIKLVLSYLDLGEPGDFVRLELMRTAVLQDETPSLSLDISERLFFRREYDRVFIGPPDGSPKRQTYLYFIETPNGEIAIPEVEAKLRYTTFPAGAETVSSNNNEAFFDLERLRFPLAVRTRRDGDRIQPMGLNGSKKVKDIFIDEKIPPRERGLAPIVTDAEGTLLWIPGIKRSNHALVTRETKRVFKIQLLRM